jgi:hypothetical protein
MVQAVIDNMGRIFSKNWHQPVNSLIRAVKNRFSGLCRASIYSDLENRRCPHTSSNPVAGRIRNQQQDLMLHKVGAT